jgi:hypothetical protein
MFDEKQIREDLEYLTGGITKEMKQLIKLNGSFASGELYNSIKTRVDKKGEDWKIKFMMIYYGLFVDKGTRPGHYPPIDDLRQWARYKGIPQDKVEEIQEHIFKYGTKARPFTTPLEEGSPLIKELLNDIGETFIDDAVEQIMQDAKYFGARLK